MKRVIFFFLFLTVSIVNAQLWDDFDGTNDLVYTTNDLNQWSILSQEFVSATNGVTTPEHSCASYNMTNKIASWNLANANTNEWIIWIKSGRSIGGWGVINYSCGFVLAADGSDFSNSGVTGYAIVFKNGSSADDVTLVKFSQGISSGSSNLPSNSTEITSIGVDPGTTGINIYIKLQSDGTFVIKYKSGVQLSITDAIDNTKYSDGSVTSTADNTYRGSSYIYSGFVYAHGAGIASTDHAYFDNYGFSQDNALPVELTSFTAALIDNVVQLNWQTATEVNNYGFEVERQPIPNPFQRQGNSSWTKIGFVNGHGNSNSPKSYSFTDNLLLAHDLNRLQYRLKQIDFDGKFEYSNIVAVNVEVPAAFVLHQNSPNPFNPTTEIKFSLPKNSNVELSVYNLLGEIVQTLANGMMNAGEHKVVFEASNLSSGVYIYKLTTDNYFSTRKMVLLK